MLSLGQTLNGFTILSIVGQFRAGTPDGAVILARRPADDCLVVASVEQDQCASELPAHHWTSGQYFHPDEYADGLDVPSLRAVITFLDATQMTAMLGLRDLVTR